MTKPVVTDIKGIRMSSTFLRHLHCAFDIDARPWTAMEKTVGPILVSVAIALSLHTPAQAQATNTYVSGRGNDSNPCTTDLPCQTLQAAFGKTMASGQIYVLDSADYGNLTIDKAVSIISARGATGVLATSGVSGIIINAGPNDAINLQGFNIDGAGSGANGILFQAGASLRILDSVVRGFNNGISFQPTGPSSLLVEKTTVSNNSTGINFQNSLASTGVLNDVQIVNNDSGLVTLGPSSTAPANVSVQSSIVANNKTVGILSGSFSSVVVSDTTIANNGLGLQAVSPSARLQLSGSTLSGNSAGWAVSNGGQVTSSSNNSIVGNAGGDVAPPTTTPPTPPPPPVMVAKNIVTDFGAVCNGVIDDSPAFAAFNSWAQDQTLLVQLTIPAGKTCSFLGGAGESGRHWVRGIKKLVVLGYGATITTQNRNVLEFTLGGQGQYNDNAHSTRLFTVAAGASSVKVNPSSTTQPGGCSTVAACTALFTVGRYALITGYDLQGMWKAPYGYPSNPHFFEYVKITGKDPATGTITFEAPLVHSYKSTWPNYNTGNQYEVDSGGPATLYALPANWDTEVEYRGLTISQEQFQTYAPGKSITYRDVTFTGQACGIPTNNLIWQAINTDMSTCIMEVDKLIGTIAFDNVAIYDINFQSSSTNLVSIKNSNIRHALQGTPKRAVISDSQIALFKPGAFAYGRSDEVICSNCVISQLQPAGVSAPVYPISAGVITIPNTEGAVPWAVPGTNLMWRGDMGSQTGFQVVDITQDDTNTYVRTNLEGGIPVTDAATHRVRVHPAPKFTCTNCTGNPDVVDLSQAPAGAPLYSYSKRTYTGSLNGAAPVFEMWGKVSSIKYNVITPYTGVRATLGMNVISQFNRYRTIKANGAMFDYGPSINLKIAGERVVTPSGVTGAKPGDGGLSVPEAVWFTGRQDQGPAMWADVGSESSSVWPTISIEIMTDQGIMDR
jgi:hypothetical protein